MAGNGENSMFSSILVWVGLRYEIHYEASIKVSQSDLDLEGKSKGPTSRRQ
jgi:hypothetical protein